MQKDKINKRIKGLVIVIKRATKSIKPKNSLIPNILTPTAIILAIKIALTALTSRPLSNKVVFLIISVKNLSIEQKISLDKTSTIINKTKQNRRQTQSLSCLHQQRKIY